MNVTLQKLFESRKERLSAKLSGMSLPKDTDAVYRTIYDYLNEVFDADGDFRQNLTQSEDYILQVAISLLNAQKDMAISMKPVDELEPKKEEEQNSSIPEDKSILYKFTDPSSAASLIGSGAGAIAGKVLFGGWGAVFGALAGTAIAIFASSAYKQPKAEPKVLVKVKAPASYPVNVDVFIAIISSICASVDNLLDTFRAQINNVVQKYESQPKPTLDLNYLPLLESIQTLVGYARTHSESEDKYARKLRERIEDVSEVLDTWDLRFVDYDGTNSSFFEKIPSDKAQEDKMVYPAIVKEGIVIIKGKVFIPIV